MRKTEVTCDRCSIVIDGNVGTAALEGFGATKAYDLCSACFHAVLMAATGAALLLREEALADKLVDNPREQPEGAEMPEAEPEF